MKIKLLSVELDSHRLPIIVQEKEYNSSKQHMRESSDVVKMLNEYFRLDQMAEEYLYMISLDAAGHIQGVFQVSHGGVNYSYAGPREIYQRALLSGAVGIVLVHNHPSGDIDPSDIDILSCNRLKKAGELIGINLYDFVIVGADNRYYSFAEDKLSTQFK